MSNPGRPAPEAPEDFAREVLALIDAGDIRCVAAAVHPEYGIRFSPYANVRLNTDVRLRPAEPVAAWNENRFFNWGRYDGSGEPIALPIHAYVEQFVMDANFAGAPKVGVNEVIGRGNSIDNLDGVYPEATVVEFRFPGFNPAYQGMDWRSLRLVLRPRGDGGWWLVGVVHDAWTV